MKTYRKEMWFNTSTRRALINITPQVAQCLQESGIRVRVPQKLDQLES